MRTLQAHSGEWRTAIAQARALNCEAVAWTLAGDVPEGEVKEAVRAADAAGLKSQAWVQVARDPEAAQKRPEWMHCPQHHEWLRRFPEYPGMHPALVAPYIGLNTQAAFEYALARTKHKIEAAGWARQVWLADIQGPPMGCGCGNPCCRSWDNAPGPKLPVRLMTAPKFCFHWNSMPRSRRSYRIPNSFPCCVLSASGAWNSMVCLTRTDRREQTCVWAFPAATCVRASIFPRFSPVFAKPQRVLDCF